jgi:8-hydroxy-5-deazaflavin:NADPH oxidoreductase
MEFSMTYAIIGTGPVGATLARFFAAKTIPVLIANSRGSELTAELDASVNPVTVDEAVEADIILVALGSVAYKKGLPHMTVYSSTKAAIRYSVKG